MMTPRQGVIAALVAGSLVGGTAGAMILDASSARHHLTTASAVSHTTSETAREPARAE
jgi:hypothetical protein